MTGDVSALTYLINSAPELNGRLLQEIDLNKAHFELTVELPDGRSMVYELYVETENNGISVREITSEHLPTCCPERHINFDATFCLGWQYDQDLKVTDHATALNWWSVLQRFLILQARATNSRRWPGKEWAHGPAAIHQLKAENAAKSLGDGIYNLLIQNKLTVTTATLKGTRGSILRLYDGKIHRYSVLLDLDMVANKRQLCFCQPKPIGKRKRIKSCGDHAFQIKELIKAIYNQEKELKQFWSLFKSKHCCNTLNSCPMMKNN